MRTSSIFGASTRVLLLTISLLLVGGTGYAQQDNPFLDNTVGLPPLSGPNPQPGGGATINIITTPDGYDNFDLGTTNAEPHMSTNPLNPLWFFNAFNTNSAFRTLDGTSWAASSPSFPSAAGDPVTAYDSLGNLYYETMKNPITGTWVIKSTNGGQTWTSAVSAATGNDKNWIACDQTMGPYANYIYTTMTNSGVGNFSRSTDLGATFQTMFAPSTQSLPGMMVAVGPNMTFDPSISGGCVYVVTHSGTNAAGVYTFYLSTNGGSSFTQKSSNQFSNLIGTEVSSRSTVQAMRCRPYPMIAADNSYGPYRGRLYLVYASNNPAGNGNKSDIFLRYSTDQGATWSSPRVANDDVNSQNNFQFHPAIWCDKETGRLYIKFYDTRRVPTSDSMDVYATYTDDGGETYAPNQRLTNKTFKINFNNAAAPAYKGDYDAITSNKYASMAVWTDFRNNSYLGMTAYFPDFAMLVSPTATSLGMTDSTDVVVKIPDVKLYTHSVKFSATVSPAASFSFSFPSGDSLTSYPDSVTLRIKTSGVTPGNYTVTVTGEGPNGTPVHRRAVAVTVNFLSQGWTAQTSGVTSYLYSVKAVSNSIAWASGNSGVVLRTTNGGTNWTNVGGGNLGTMALYNIEAVNANTAFVTGTPSTTTYILRTNNGGTSWDTVYTQAGGFINAIKMFSPISGIALGDPVGGRWTIVRTSDAGATWVRDTVNAPLQVGSEAGTQNGLSTVGTTHIWFNSGVGGRIYRSTDGGATWSSGTTSFPATSNVAFNSTQYGVATGSTASNVARSTDGGATWTDVTVGGTGFLIACAGSAPDNFWYARGTTIYRSTDRGATFSSSFVGTGTYVALSFYTSSGSTTGWAVTSTGGVAAFSGNVTDVDETPGRPSEIPRTVALRQNYPNPFNPSTTIRYELPSAGHVQLKIYNSLGQEVRTLIDNYSEAGEFTTVWDGQSDAIEPVSSGVYFYRIEVRPDNGAAYTNVRKMVLVK